MKVCIYGVGAIGGFFGARLASRTDCIVSAVARGATREALATHGWRLVEDGKTVTAPVARLSDDPSTLGVQDVVVLAVKGQALPAIADRLAPLLGPDTLVLTAMNGVPWWFNRGIASLGDAPIESVDPGGRIGRAVPFERVVGCVIHASTFTTEPGLVVRKMGQGLIIGPAGGGTSSAVDALAALLGRAGFEMTVSPGIRRDVWYKLWGNLTTNPISAITGATVDRILADDEVRHFCTRAMDEAKAIGARIGCAIEQTPDDRHVITRKLGAFKTSMLQDVDAGRTIELDAIVGATRELGRRVGVETPNIDALFGLTRLFARVHGLYPD